MTYNMSLSFQFQFFVYFIIRGVFSAKMGFRGLESCMHTKFDFKDKFKIFSGKWPPITYLGVWRGFHSIPWGLSFLLPPRSAF